MRTPSVKIPRRAWTASGFAEGEREIPEEVAVALVYDGTTHAVMMATPNDLQDFAIGFTLTERLAARPEEIVRLEVVETRIGIELRMWLAEARAAALAGRRRQLVGPTGCGLCGIESLEEALPPLRPVPGGGRFSAEEVMFAMASIAEAQALNRATHAVHAAAFWHPSAGLVALREDVGRHNALDKLAGAMAGRSVRIAEGIVVLTSRVSVEMVQKTAALGASVIVAVSAPTTLAVRTADAAGITLVAVARVDGFEVFTHPQRIGERMPADVTR